MKTNFKIKKFYRKNKFDIVGTKLWLQHSSG